MAQRPWTKDEATAATWGLNSEDAYFARLGNLMNPSGSASGSYSGGANYEGDGRTSKVFLPVNVGSAPTMPDVGEYKAPNPYVAPEYDEGRVNELTQSTAAPAVRGLRSAMQRISSSSEGNPNAKRMTLREALAGYGQGLQSTMSGAATTARSLYNQEYGIKADEAKTNYGAEVETGKINFNAKLQQQMAKYQADLATYMAKYQADLATYMAQMYGTGATKYGAVTNAMENGWSSSTTSVTPRYAYGGGTVPSSSSSPYGYTTVPSKDQWGNPTTRQQGTDIFGNWV
jgi:hypothetical protein